MALVLLVAACASGGPDEADGSKEALIARAAGFELDTEWETPPGDPMELATAGFAKILCSAVFVTGLTVAEGAEDVGYFVSKLEERALVTDTVVDFENRAVHLTLNTGATVSAKFYGDQGCVTLPRGADSVSFTPVPVESALPDAMTLPWPMGDMPTDNALPAGVDADKVAEAVAAAFDPDSAMTAAFVVVHQGQIIGERYMDGLDKDTQLESWSMGKSITGTLMGTLVNQGVYGLWDAAPIDNGTKPRAILEQTFGSAISCACRRAFDLWHRRTRTTTTRSDIRRAIPIITTCTLARSTRISGRSIDRPSGHPTLWVDIGTLIL